MFAVVIARGARESVRGNVRGDDLIAALLPYAQSDVTGVWQDEFAVVAQATWHNTPESLHEQAPEVCRETGRVIASWIRLDNRPELCATLKLPSDETLTDPQLVLAAHRAWGSDCAEKLEGDFSFVIYDPAKRETYCARDSIGAKPFYYHLTDGHFIASTSVAPILTIEGLNLQPSLQWTALFLSLLNFAHTRSAYESVAKLAPANDLCIGVEGSPAMREYFRFDLSSPHAAQRDTQWVDDYRKAFDRAITMRARSAFFVGAESSAGLDSSSIAATLVNVLPHDRDDFHTFGRCEAEHEPELLLATAARSGIRHTHILMKPELLQLDASFHRALKALGHPPEHWQMLHQPSFFEHGKQLGVRTLLSGYGGDEVVSSFAKGLPVELLARGAYGAALRELPGLFPARLARLGKMMRTGPPDQAAGFKKVYESHFLQACIREEVLRDPKFVETIEQWSLPSGRKTDLNTLLANGLGFRFARSGRLESEAIYSATYGIEYRYPLLDRNLIQQYFATPAIEKRHRGMGRYLHRRAVEGRVPERIVWQKTKSMGGHIGGASNVPRHMPSSFSELPSLLQSIIDEDAYRVQRRAFERTGDDFGERSPHRDIFFFQLRQLATWLEGHASPTP